MEEAMDMGRLNISHGDGIKQQQAYNVEHVVEDVVKCKKNRKNSFGRRVFITQFVVKYSKLCKRCIEKSPEKI